MTGETTREKVEKLKKVTVEAREHLREIHQEKEDAGDPRSGKLKNLFQKNEVIHNQAETVVQNGLVSQAFFQLSVKANEQAQKLTTGLQDYDLNSLVSKMRESPGLQGYSSQAHRGSTRHALTQNTQEDEEDDTGYIFDYAVFGRKVFHHFSDTPGLDFMLGATEIKVRATPKLAREPKQKNTAKVVTAKELTGQEAAGQTETDKQIEEMNSLLGQRKKENYYKLVIDPDSFSRSVENIFHSSFLVKDGRARLQVTEGEPVVVAKPPASDALGTSFRPSQMIMRFDHSAWKTVTDDYDIDKVELPSKSARKSRPPREHPSEEKRSAGQTDSGRPKRPRR